ncbi:MAG: hypothetical protein CVV24_08915 [Ignavibacteriae bacterium HGW-Ignavibacteriae-3]|nr:MAG: hypothetical protein CVV24_08915 [Ignavibacteriae bacterium HGW-Ignavibacteriae-3]
MPGPVLLGSAVSQNVNLLIDRGNKKGIEILSEIPKTQTVTADESMLNSIIRNLLSNAIKFTSKGGKVIFKSRETENNMIEISVSDNGIGMSRELVSKLFKLEEKVGRPGTEGEASTGLGLLLCKEFVEKHKGKIWAKSVLGEGSTFYFTVPAG